MSGEASGIEARGYSWPPFERGNQVAVRHGCYAVVQLTPHAEAIVNETRERMPSYAPSDERAIRHYAMLAARLERAHVALDYAELSLDPDPLSHTTEQADKLDRLKKDVNNWARLVRDYERDLGLNSRSRVQLGATAITGQLALDEFFASRRSEGEGNGDA